MVWTTTGPPRARGRGRPGRGCSRRSVPIEIVVDQQLECLDWFVFADDHVDVRMAGGRLAEDGQQRDTDPGGESANAQRPGGFCVGTQVEASGVDGGDKVTAWAASRRPAGLSRTRRPSGSMSLVPAPSPGPRSVATPSTRSSGRRRLPPASSRGGTAPAAGAVAACPHRRLSTIKKQ